MKSPLVVALAAALAVSVTPLSTPARAHGAIPTSNAIGFGPGSGVFLGTNFGGVLIGADQRFICELALTGLQQSVGVWLWLHGGEVLGIVPTGGITRGVFASDPSACRYDVLAGTDAYLMTDLAQDASAPSSYYATGRDDTVAVLLQGAPGAAATVVYSDAATPIATPAGVRAAGGHAYAIFERAGTATLVHDDGVAATTIDQPLAEGESLRPLGVSPTTPRTLWLTRSGPAGDTLLRSDDAGLTLTAVLTVDARLGGFAIDGTTVWVQSARGGMHRSEDDGRTFAPLAQSPHGTCLALAPDRRLYACGVPWQDGFALGVSSDGKTFAPVMPYYDGIVGAVDCPANPTTTITCDGELEFLRGYYGFSNPNVAEPGPEPSAEPNPEPDPEPGDTTGPLQDTTEATAEAAPRRPADDGCATAANTASSLMILLALGLLARARSHHAR